MNELLRDQLIKVCLPYFETRLNRQMLIFEAVDDLNRLDGVRWNLSPRRFTIHIVSRLSKPEMLRVLRLILAKEPLAQPVREAYLELQTVGDAYWPIPPPQPTPDDESSDRPHVWETDHLLKETPSSLIQLRTLVRHIIPSNLTSLLIFTLAIVAISAFTLSGGVDQTQLSTAGLSAGEEAPPPSQTTLARIRRTHHTGWVQAVTFSPDGSMLASVSNDRSVRLWDLTQEPLFSQSERLGEHGAGIHSAVFSPDGTRLATGGSDATIKVWHVADQSKAPQIIPDIGGSVLILRFSPDGQRLAAGTTDNSILVYDLENLSAPPTRLQGHRYWIWALEFEDNSHLISAGGDGTMRRWQVDQPETAETLHSNLKHMILTVDVDQNGRWLLTGDAEGEIELWDLRHTGRDPQRIATLPERVRAVSFSEDGRYIVAACDDQLIRLWDRQDLAEDPIILTGHTDWVSDVAFSPDGKFLASASFDYSVRLWQLPLH